MLPKKRLFFALWPDDRKRQRCVEIIQRLDSKMGRPVQPANLHVTLLFLGNIDENKEYIFRERAAMIVAPQLELCFNQLRYWKKPGLFCLTTTEIGSGIVRLVRDLTLIAEKLDIAVDKRAFQPHVTLVRKVTGPQVLEFEPIDWVSSSFCLVESFHKADQSDYRIIEEWACKAS